MTDDHLKLIKFISSDIFQSTPMKILLGSIFAIHVIVDLITVYYMLSTFDAKLFINYSSVFLGDFYPLLAIFVLLYKSKVIHNLKNELELWSTDSTSKKLQSKINLNIKFLKMFVIFNSLLFIVVGVTFVQPLSKDYDVFFAYRLIHEYFPNYGHIFEFLYRTTYLLTSYIATVLPFQIFYYCQHTNFQLQMSIEQLKNLTKWSEDDENLVDNTKYQTEINRRLKICIQRSQNFIRLHSEKIKEISKFIAGFALCACLLGIGVIFYLISGNFTPEYYLRMGATSVAGITTFAATMWAGQSTESAIDDMVTSLNEVEWYNFNQSNKKLYLIFLTNSMKTRTIKFTENYSFNYQLGLGIVKGIYSVISILL
ncbi:uncharacterized protein LOC123011882 [Tribolium madens]|uniref:uncharacterized protein LOC123011882 n=1 Tax=Tribolium madens TaxID=41895 RepID=UPI001CF763B1|nr:uncharacterized protein LOC123011882 [Tribolium madens]